MHVVMGTIVGLIAFCLVVIAIILTPKLARLRIGRMARYAFAVMMISLGAYLAVVSNLFFHDELGDINYTPEITGIRILALIGSIWFLIAVYRCRL